MKKVLYHANCLDGSGAAMAAWLELGDDGVEYLPVQYGEDPPPVDGDEVYIVDFSYKRAVLSEMAKKAKRIVAIDHHKTAKEDLSEPIPGVETHFDMSRSGAVLAWEYFHESEIPKILLHIQDRDLWEWKIPLSKPILRALPVMWPDWRDWIGVNTSELAKQGEVIQAFIDAEIEKIVSTGPVDWNGYRVPIYNLQGFMISETLHRALAVYPDSPFAVAYFDLPDKRIYSLRSRKGEFDVSELAKSFGGGGHVVAAGFTTKPPLARFV